MLDNKPCQCIYPWGKLSIEPVFGNFFWRRHVPFSTKACQQSVMPYICGFSTSRYFADNLQICKYELEKSPQQLF